MLGEDPSAEGEVGLSRSPLPHRAPALDFPLCLWQLYSAACVSSPSAKGHVLKAAAGFGDIKRQGEEEATSQASLFLAMLRHVCVL